jgi:raffinose/stachyose/melibiose transport system permease protein
MSASTASVPGRPGASRAGLWGGRAASYLLLALLAAAALGPTLWVVLSSFSTAPQIYGGQVVPDSFSLDGYRELFAGGDLTRSTLNTLIYALGGTLGALVVGLLAAYPTARMRFPFRGALTLLFSVSLAIPVIGLLVPEYYLMYKAGLYDTRLGLVLFYTALFFPLAFVILRAYLVRIPLETEEAAIVEGAGYFTILTRIILPLSRPALATVAVVVFINVWNDFLFALVLAPSPSNQNVQVALSTFKAQFQFDVTAMLAGATVVMVVPIAAFLLLQRHVVAGLTAGSSR